MSKLKFMIFKSNYKQSTNLFARANVQVGGTTVVVSGG